MASGRGGTIHFISRGPGMVERTRIADDDIFLKFKLYENVKSRPLREKEQRSRFAGPADYWLYCFSLTGSLANLTRFPYLAYSYNGCSFIVQFIILLAMAGIPWCFMETYLGQYSGRGPTAIGDMVPAGKGVALAMGYICLLNVICYSPIQSRCLVYMSMSFSDELPWAKCINKTLCMDDSRNLTSAVTKSAGIELRVPVENYYLNRILNMEKSILNDGLGQFFTPLVYGLAFSWVINFLLLVGDKYITHIRIFGSIAPYVFLITLLALVIVQEDSWVGVKNLFDPSTIDLLDLHGWRRAAEQVFYSLDVGTGHLILFGKNCDFHTNILSNILIIALMDMVCAVSASIVIYGVIQKLATRYHILFQFVFVSGPGMFFLAVAQTVIDLPYPRFFNFIAFFVMFVLSILTQLSFLSPVLYLMNAYFGQFNYSNLIYCVSMSVVMFLLSLATVTQGGDALISLLDDIGSAMGILMITTSEVIFVFCIYGINEFFADLSFMTDRPPSLMLKILFIGGPILVVHIMLASFFHWNSPSFHNVTYPRTAYISAWILASITALIILCAAIWTIMKAVSHERTLSAFEPSRRWVPDLTYSLENDQLDTMMEKREDVMLANYDNLIFGIGKPILSKRLDQSVQTGGHSNTEIKTYYNSTAISDDRLLYLYLEFVKYYYNTEYELIRRYNEREVLAWNNLEYMEFLLPSGVLEKSVQTDINDLNADSLSDLSSINSY